MEWGEGAGSNDSVSSLVSRTEVGGAYIPLGPLSGSASTAADMSAEAPG